MAGGMTRAAGGGGPPQAGTLRANNRLRVERPQAVQEQHSDPMESQLQNTAESKSPMNAPQARNSAQARGPAPQRKDEEDDFNDTDVAGMLD